MKNIVIIVILFAGILLSAYILQNQDENRHKAVNELLYFPSGKLIKQVSLDYKLTMTNMMWLQIIQYYGEHMLTDKYLTHLYNLFDIVTNLDPQFLQCYVFGGTIITYDQKRPDLGMKLLLKGMKENPDKWQIPFIAGFINYMYVQNYNSAYKWFVFASTKPEAPYYCKTFAAASLNREGDYFTALKLWTQIFNNSNNRLEKENAVKNMTVFISQEFNKKRKDIDLNALSVYINEEIKKMDFLPFNLNVKIKEDTVIVESR